MPMRVLTTIKESNKLLGFRVMSTKYGMAVVDLKKAVDLYSKEPFENVEFDGQKWRGLECSLDKLPVQDRFGNYLSRDAEIIVLRRILDANESTSGFEFMNLDGKITSHDIPEALKLAAKYKLINAQTDGKYIRAIRGELKVKKTKKDVAKVIKDNTSPMQQNPTINSGVYTGINPNITPVVIKPRPQQTTSNVLAVANTDTKSDKAQIVLKGNKNSMDEKLKRQKELTDELALASYMYYVADREIMDNLEYDKKELELEILEKETGVVFSGSVTQKVGGAYAKSTGLSKVIHPSPMLSLDKTKDPAILAEVLGNKEGYIGWKLDGLTVVATYENGKLVSAVTRGNGKEGEDITNNYRVFTNVPLTINYPGRLVLRGEALISYAVFEAINATITNEDDKYANPRNLCSGSVRQLDPKVAKARKISFVVFEVVEGFDDINSKTERFDKAESLGFEVVEYKKVTKDQVAAAIEWFKDRVSKIAYPTDGLVLGIDDIAYGKSLGSTNKFPRNAKAFKWQDEEAETPLKYVHWSCSRTGAINPVAVFKPVNLEGSKVSRASLSNVSILESLELGEGDILTVYKANMIIPQVADNLTRSNTLKLPTKCPVCGGEVEVRQKDSKNKNVEPAKVLYCKNPNCSAKNVGAFAHFVQRDAMNMDGIAESTLEKLMGEGIIRTFKDLYHLEDKKAEILDIEGVKEGLYKKWLKAVEKGREVELPNFIYALGVDQLGKTTSKDLCKAFDYDIEKFITATEDDLRAISGVGDVTVKEYLKYFGNPDNISMIRELLQEVKIKAPKVVTVVQSPFTGKTVLATGTLQNFDRNGIKAKFEELGAKVSSGVSAKLDYVLVGDAAGPSKLQKLKELNDAGAGIEIINEEEFLKMIENL